MTDLGRYPYETQAIADELLEYLVDDVRKAAIHILTSTQEGELLRMSPEEADRAYKLLSQTPSQRDRSLAKLDNSVAALLLIRARYLGLKAAQAMLFAEHFSYVRGKGYRQATEYVARKAMAANLEPPLDLILPGWDDEGLEDI